MSSRKARQARQQAPANGKPASSTHRARRRTGNGLALPGVLLVALLLLGIVSVTAVTAARRTPTSAAAGATPQPIAKTSQVLVYVPEGQPAWQSDTLARVGRETEFQYAGRLFYIDANGTQWRRENVNTQALADTDRVFDPANWRFPESGDVVRFVDGAGRHRFHQIMDRMAAGDRFWFQGVLYAVFINPQNPQQLGYQPAGRVLAADEQAMSTVEYVARHGGETAIVQAQDRSDPSYNPAVAAANASPASGASEQLGLMPRFNTSPAVAVAAPSAPPVAPAVAAAPAASSSLPTDYLFTGQKWDSATGLYKMGNRYYDPVLGRFISPDPYIPDLTNPQDLNRYSYARNNPLKYTDPTGHFPYTPLPFPDFWLPQAGQALSQAWMRVQPYAYQLAADLSQFAASPQAALALQNAQQMQAHASQMQQAASQVGNTGDPGQFDPNKWDPKKTVDAAKDVAQTLKKYSLDSGDCSKAADKVYTTLTKAGYQAERVKWSYTATTEPNRMILADGRVVSSTRGVTYAYHEFVRVGDRVFDAITGPEGMLWKDYLSQWDPYTLHWIVETVASAP